MMYRLTVDVFIPGNDVDRAKLQELYDRVELRWAEYLTANEREHSRIMLHRCFHDEANPQPCVVLSERVR